jgi:hypothetical protein
MKYKKYIWIFFILSITAVVYYIRKQKAVEGFMTEDEFVTEANHRIKTMQAIKASINDSLNAFDKSAKETCDLTPKYRDAYVSATAAMPKYNALTNDERQKSARTEYDEQRINYIASGTPIYECFATQDEVYTATQKLKSEIKELSDLLESPRLRIMLQKGKLLTGLQGLNASFSGSKMVFESFVVNEDLIESADTLIKLAREIQTVSRTVVINTSRLTTDLVNIPTYVRNRYTEQNRQKNKSKIYSDLINDDIVTQLLGPNNYLQLLYKASRDGYSATTFHQKADNQGPTLTVFRTNNGRIAGGYNPISWRSSYRWIRVEEGKAFLFNIVGLNVNKFFNNRNLEYSIEDNGSMLPSFGGGNDFRLYDNGTVRSSASTYLNNYSSELFGTNYTSVSEIEVFKVT